ncbi:pectate lyase-like adhesive domain-containing protein [Listeria aquatica]|uniref:pectate lyase-like adhesive domain-containing protein n=1 Tax=Listeria aquatica TaxID=1494960 RepID=UPI003F6E4538
MKKILCLILPVFFLTSLTTAHAVEPRQGSTNEFSSNDEVQKTPDGNLDTLPSSDSTPPEGTADKQNSNEEKSVDKSDGSVDQSQPKNGKAGSEQDSESLSSNTAKERSQTRAASEIVTTYDEFVAAVKDSSVTEISIGADIQAPISGGNGIYVNMPARDLVIEGNNHNLDLQERVFGRTSASDATLTVKNANIYGRSFYGPFVLASTLGLTQRGTIIYENGSYTGGEFGYASANGTYKLAGSFKYNGVASYVNPINGNSYNVPSPTQAVFEVGNVSIAPGANVTLNPYTHSIAKSNFLVDSDSTLTINPGEKTSTEAAGVPRGVLDADSLSVKSGATLNITATDTTNAGVSAIYMANGAPFTVEPSANVNLLYSNQSTRTTPIVNNISTLTVGSGATFVAQSDGSGNRTAIDLQNSSSKISLDSVEKFDLDMRNNSNTSSSVIKGSGTFVADNHRVRVWNRGNVSDTEDQQWNPINSMTAVYSSSSTDSVEATSDVPDVANDFQTNYKAENYSRILYTPPLAAGDLKLEVPDTINFGVNKIANSSQKYPVINDAAVKVVDTRTNKSEWSLAAQLTSPFENQNDGNVIDEGISLKDGINDTTLLVGQDSIVKQVDTGEAETVINLKPNADQGMYLSTQQGDVTAGKYDTTIKWTLRDTP